MLHKNRKLPIVDQASKAVILARVRELEAENEQLLTALKKLYTINESEMLSVNIGGVRSKNPPAQPSIDEWIQAMLDAERAIKGYGLKC